MCHTHDDETEVCLPCQAHYAGDQNSESNPAKKTARCHKFSINTIYCPSWSTFSEMNSLPAPTPS